MFFLNVLKKPFIIISCPIYYISFGIAYKATLFHFELPVFYFRIFGLFLVKQYANDKTVIYHDSEKGSKELDNVSELQIFEIVFNNVILIETKILKIS